MNKRKLLASRDTRGKIRTLVITCMWSEVLQCYLLERTTSQLGGKQTKQPVIEIKSGKSNRTATEQARLEFESHLNKYKNKGYIELTGCSSFEGLDFEELIPRIAVDTNGAKKPMLAKKYSDVASSTFDKLHYCSKKLDGVRCQIRINNDGIIVSSSRGGKDYDIPAQHILSNPIIEKILKDKEIIKLLKTDKFSLDGELYIHGKPLPYISGLCRKINREDSHNELKYYIYDISVDNILFKHRLEALKIVEDIVEQEKCESIVVLKHFATESWLKIKSYHDSFVKDGYEGCVLRNPNKDYGYNKKDSRMIKVKEFDDAEFEIIGYESGLRIEDFVFVLTTKNNLVFKAKPIGDVATREDYLNNIDSIIGKMGTVKYFGLTPKGIPNLPIFKYVRLDDDK